MNDYRTLFAFVQSTVNSVPNPQDSRDLRAYFKEKLDDVSNDRDDVKAMCRRALKVAGLDYHFNSAAPSTLDQPVNAHKRACAATLLAMSIIRDTNEGLLRQDLARLQRMQTPAVVTELRAILSKGDKVRSTRHPRLELKNFVSAGARSTLWQREIEDAYGRAHELLLNCETLFLPPAMKLTSPGKIWQSFTDYFGDPNAVVATSTIPFQAGKAPAFSAPNLPRLAVTREVLRRVCGNFVKQEVRIYFGGHAIDKGTNAYVSGDTNPTKIHVGGQFFTKAQTGLGSEAGIIVHECTHSFAGTDDHQYDSAPCKQMALAEPLKALSNADSYMFFVEAAFG
jgi:hypothetical protein